ncbi:MAG: hypothetical protein EA385_00100 [Salinarimonadaceae bacterium]|nr:MAG: hypothetical protein EA385_00100 [Salinarimonadaceae bacterium]
MDAKTLDRLRKLVAMLDTPEEHEQVNAMHRINDLLRSQGMTFVDFARRLELATVPTGPPDDPPTRDDCTRWVELCDRLLDADAWTSDKERDFLETVRKWARRGKPPSEKQQVWLDDIASRTKTTV